MSDFETKYDSYYKASLNLFRQNKSVEDVFQYVDSIEDNEGSYRDTTLGKLALFLISEQKISDALRFCVAILDPLERADALFEVARALWKEKQYDSAREFLNAAAESARVVERPYETAMVFLQIAALLERLGEQKQASQFLREAVDLAKPMPQNFEASKTLRGCARLLASWNRISEANEVVQAIEVPELRAAALEEIQGRGKWPVYPGVRIE